VYAIKITGITTPILTDFGYIYISYLKPEMKLLGFSPEDNKLITSKVVAIKRRLTYSTHRIFIKLLSWFLEVCDDDLFFDDEENITKTFNSSDNIALYFGFPEEFFSDEQNPKIFSFSRFGIYQWNPENKKHTSIYSKIATNTRRLLKGFFRISAKDFKKAHNSDSLKFITNWFLEFINFLELAYRIADPKSIHVGVPHPYYEVRLKFHRDNKHNNSPTKVISPIKVFPSEGTVSVSNIIITETPIFCLTAGIKRV